jgi:alanine-glyoxylate transaminase/serine-glyoxylate transaminase/serine-pyruvate transaminase
MAATLGGLPLYVEEWELDAVYANPQKCLSAPPGLSPLAMSDRAMHKIRNRKTPTHNWCLDLGMLYALATATPIIRFYPYTSPIHCFYALHEALLMLYEEGLVPVWDRHATNAQALTAGIRSLGFNFMTEDNLRIPFLNVVEAPDGISVNDFRTYMSRQFSLEISHGMGEWHATTLRIGAMGQTSTKDNIIVCLNALGQTLQHFGKIVNIEGAIAASKRLTHYDISQPRYHHPIANGNVALS